MKRTNISRQQIKFLVLSATLFAGLFTQESSLSQPAPYPPSDYISSITWDTGSKTQAAPGSDLWPTTWGADGNIYTSWGDGGGFGGTNSLGRVSMGFARMEGPPASYTGINVNGGYNSIYASSFPSKGKTAGMLSVNGTLYAWVNMQNGSPPDTKLIWSYDMGKTWQLSTWKFPDPADRQFMPSSFVNFGQDYSNAKDNYIYSYGGKWIPTDGPENNAYLMRVDKSQIQVRSAYQFFAGFDTNNNPIWSSNIQDRQPAFSDPNGVGNPGLVSVIYNEPLARFILTAAHRAPPGSGARFPDFGTPSNLGIFESMTPWGPWKTVAYYEDWLGFGDNDEALVYSLPTKWISSDGKTIWLIFSSWPGSDSFNMVKGTLTLTPTQPPSTPTGVSVNKR